MVTGQFLHALSVNEGKPDFARAAKSGNGAADPGGGRHGARSDELQNGVLRDLDARPPGQDDPARTGRYRLMTN